MLALNKLLKMTIHCINLQDLIIGTQMNYLFVSTLILKKSRGRAQTFSMENHLTVFTEVGLENMLDDGWVRGEELTVPRIDQPAGAVQKRI